MPPEARGLRDAGGRALRGADGRARTRACPGTCCGGTAPGCRYYPAVLCSTWTCEPPGMAGLLPGAGANIWLCICPPTQAPVGSVFRIQTRCYRITGDGIDAPADGSLPVGVGNADWVYTCDGQLLPPVVGVGSSAPVSRHRLISEAACGTGNCAVNLCSKWVELTPCGGGPGCPRRVFAPADQYVYGRAVPVVCAGGGGTFCYCAEATPDVLTLAQLPTVRQLVTTPPVDGDCCRCIDLIGGDCTWTSDGSILGRRRICCCPDPVNWTGTMRATLGTLTIEWVDVLRLMSAGSLQLSVRLRITDSATGRVGTYGPYNVNAPCGVGIYGDQFGIGGVGNVEGLWPLRARHNDAGLAWAYSDGWIDPLGPRTITPAGFGSRFPDDGAGWVRGGTRGCASLVVADRYPALGIANDLTVEWTGDQDSCEGCGSGQGPGNGDVGELIP